MQDAATTIRFARFDADGKLQGFMYDLQAPVKDREAVQPLLLPVGDDVGLLWAEGSIIYVRADRAGGRRTAGRLDPHLSHVGEGTSGALRCVE